LRGLLARLRTAEERARALEQAAQKSPPLPVLSPERPKGLRTGSRPKPAAAGWDADEDPDAPARGENRLIREIKSRYGSFVRERAGFDALTVLADVQTRLEDLPGLDPAELFDAAADLAALSLVLSRGLNEE